MLHSRERLLFAAKRLERFPLEIEKILLGRSRWACHVAATDDPGELSGEMGLVLRNVPGFLHEINSEPDLGSKRVSKNGQLGWNRRPVTGGGQLQNDRP